MWIMKQYALSHVLLIGKLAKKAIINQFSLLDV